MRPLSPWPHEFWFCEPGVIGSSAFVALKAPYVVHVLDTLDEAPENHLRSRWINRDVDRR